MNNNIRELKSGESLTHHCRICKGLLYEDEDGTVCEQCVLREMDNIVLKYISKRAK